MKTNNETGHAKNVAIFENLISFVSGYGEAYNPSKASITLTALQALSGGAKAAINTVNSAFPVYSNAVAARDAAFTPLSKLATRALNALKATDTTVQVDNTARTLVRKIQGTRATPKKTEEEKQAAEAEGKPVVEISSSQMSYDGRQENLNKLIQLLASVPLYSPNEADLKVEALNSNKYPG